METKGCYNYQETNTSAVCMPRVPLLEPGGGKQMYLIFWKRRHFGGQMEERSMRKEMEWGCKEVKGMGRDESRKAGVGGGQK